MRALRTAMLVGGVLGLVPAFASGGDKELKAQILNFKPTVRGVVVEYDRPPDAKAVDACQVEVIPKPAAYVLRDGQGKLLRKICATIPKVNKVNQWSYYQDGFEVYREVDLDGDQFIDEARWMNGGGTRTATIKYVNKTNVITGWRRISAEEASKVLVQALVSRDADLLETVMATPDELEALGVPAAEVERVRAAQGTRAADSEKLWKATGWGADTAWLRLDASMPHLIPADASPALKDDLTLYENAVIFASPVAGGAMDRMAFLQTTELVKVGDAWKFVDLPRAVNPAGNQPMVAVQGGIRETIFRQGGAPGEDPLASEKVQALAKYDNEHADELNSADKRKIAAAYVGRIPLLRAVEAASKKPEDKLSYSKQVVDSLGSAYQSGSYPEGLKVLNAIEAEGGKLASYAAYRRLNADFNLENDNQGANIVAIQKKWMADMKDFLAKYAASDEAPEVLFQLASNSEFNGEEKDAREYYTKLIQSYPDSLPGKKASGAIRRLDLVGQSIVLKAKGTDGQPIDAAQYRGKTLLVVFWATWAPPVKRDMPEIVKIYEKNKAKGFEIIGVDLDSDPAAYQAFLKEVPQPWPQVAEPGALDGRLAVEFGIMSVPTMILVDADGKVINRFVRSAADLDVQLDKALAGGKGVALGVR